MTLDRLAAGCWTLVAAIGLTVISGCGDGVDSAELLSQAQVALIERNYAEAERLATLIPERSQEWSAAQLLAGEAATRQDHFSDAVQFYNSLTTQNASVDEVALASFSAGEVLRTSGELTLAAKAYESTLGIAPTKIAAHERLAFLYSTTGQRREAMQHYFLIIKSGSATYQELALFGDLDRPVDRLDFLEESLAKSPGDLFTRLGIAAHHFWDGDATDAEWRLRDLVRRVVGRAGRREVCRLARWPPSKLSRASRHLVCRGALGQATRPPEVCGSQLLAVCPHGSYPPSSHLSVGTGPDRFVCSVRAGIKGRCRTDKSPGRATVRADSSTRRCPAHRGDG